MRGINTVNATIPVAPATIPVAPATRVVATSGKVHGTILGSGIGSGTF